MPAFLLAHEHSGGRKGAGLEGLPLNEAPPSWTEPALPRKGGASLEPFVLRCLADRRWPVHAEPALPAIPRSGGGLLPWSPWKAPTSFPAAPPGVLGGSLLVIPMTVVMARSRKRNW